MNNNIKITDIIIVETQLSIEDARKFFNISEKARKMKDWEHFSEIIRK